MDSKTNNPFGCLTVFLLAAIIFGGLLSLAAFSAGSQAPAPQPTVAATPATSSAPPTPVQMPAPLTEWQCDFYDNSTLAGAPVTSMPVAVLNHNWRNGSPIDDLLPRDLFSARCAHTIETGLAENYRFALTADDGARLFVDGQLVLDLWWDGQQRTRWVDVPLAPEPHTLVVEFYETTGPARLSLESEIHYDACKATFYNTTDFTGEPALQMNAGNDGRIAYDWKTGAPANVNADHFSAWWRCNLRLKAGEYRLRLKSDDVVRVIVDGNTVYDNLTGDSTGQEQIIPVRFSRNRQNVQVQYVERTGEAYLFLNWELLSAP
jgi:hypothetical protein